MKRIIFGLLILSLIMAAGCGGGGSVDSEDLKISAELPQGWREVDTDFNRQHLKFINDLGAHFFATQEDAMGKNLEEHLEAKKSFYNEQYGDVEWLDTAELRIDGREALVVTFLSQGHKQKEAYVMFGKSVVIKLHILAPEGDFEGILDDYQAILDSVKFTS